MRAHKSALTRESNPQIEPSVMGFPSPSPGKCAHRGWTDQRFETAKSLYLGGLSASQVAKELNKLTHEFVTRNSVIGVLHRRGVFKEMPEPKMKRAKGEVARRSPSVSVVLSAPSIVHVPGPAGGIGIMDLKFTSCRWIIGGTGYLAKYCGAENDGIYCGAHSLMAFTPRSEKQRAASVRGAVWAAG